MKRVVPTPGTRGYDDERVITIDKEIDEVRRAFRQLKHQRKLLIKKIQREVQT